MATNDTKDKKTKECCDSCRIKLESLLNEWANNFKMCYCPWKSKTYDIDQDNDVTLPLLKTEQESTDEEISKQATAVNSDTSKPLTSEQESTDEEISKQATAVNSDTSKPLTTEQESIDEEISKQETEDGDEKAEDKESSEVVQRVPTLEELQSLNIEPFVWNQLGFFLQVDNDSLSAIGRNAPTTPEALNQVYQFWLETAESPSWEDLAQALEGMDLRNLAAEVRQKYD